MHATLRRKRFSASLALLTFAVSIEGVLADVQPAFVWGFNTFQGTALPECARLQIFVGTTPGLPVAPKPPYTLLAYEASGITTAQSVGTDLSNLWWVVDHAAGAQLVLSMADANGNSGGVAGDLYSVASGTNTSCHPTNPTSPVSVTTNITKTLNSCDALPLKISGGTKPYTITVATIGSSSVTNVTMGSAFDTYDWINRASPNSKLITSISDASGVYAPGTNLITTTGSTDLTCGGRQSTESDSTGQASPVQSGTAAVTATNSGPTTTGTAGSGSGSKTSLGTIIGAAGGGLVLIGALVAGALFFLRRRKARASGPRPYLEDSAPYAGFGMGKVGGGAHGQGGNYMGVPEEVTPFVTAGGQGSPYRDHTPYHNSSYSSGTSDMTLGRGPSLHPQPSPQFSPAPTHQSFHGAPLPTASTTSFDPYSSYGNVPSGSSSGPSTYSASTSQPSGPVRGQSVVAGPSGGFAVANPGMQDEPDQDVKRGPVPPDDRPTSVFQHADISEVVELPPAYKERD